MNLHFGDDTISVCLCLLTRRSVAHIAALSADPRLPGQRVLTAAAGRDKGLQQASADARVPYALRLPLEKEQQPAQQTLGTLTATQRCSDGSRCGRGPALVRTTCLAFGGKLAVRRDVTMSSALPAVAVAIAVASGTNARDDHCCHCDLTEPGGILTAMEPAALGFGTIRATAGA